MINQQDIKKIEETTEEFFKKTTIKTQAVVVGFLEQEPGLTDVVNIEIKLEEPQILIGERGQTLFEIQRLLRGVLIKKLQKIFYLNLDINDYKKKKVEYLKDLAKDLADEVALTKEEKTLFPMPAYERRVIHTELSKRADVITESRGEGSDRHIVIKPK